MPIYLYLYTINILKPAKQPIEWGLAKQPIERLREKRPGKKNILDPAKKPIEWGLAKQPIQCLRAKGQGKTNMQRCKV
jgi:hypothetical protein